MKEKYPERLEKTIKILLHFPIISVLNFPYIVQPDNTHQQDKEIEQCNNATLIFLGKNTVNIHKIYYLYKHAMSLLLFFNEYMFSSSCSNYR